MKIWKSSRLVLFLMMIIAFPGLLSAVTVYEIQYTEDSSGDSPLFGQTVNVSGIITATGYYSSGNSNRFFLSDPEGGAWHGVFCFNYDFIVEVGDEVEFTAQVDEYFGFTELKNLTSFNLISSGNPVPAAIEVSTLDVSTQEAYEGCLVKVGLVEVTSTPDTHGEWYVDDGTGECQIDDSIFSYGNVPMGEEFYSIIGAIDYSYDAFGINPRSINDFILMGMPIIEEITTIPAYPVIGEDIEVRAKIVDYDGLIMTAEIIWRSITGTAGEWHTNQLLPVPGDIYKYTLPGLLDGSYYYEFTIYAEDDDGNEIESELQTINIEGIGLPFIEEIIIIPAFPFVGEDIEVQATIVDSSGLIMTADITWRSITETVGDWHTNQMLPVPGDIYKYTLPGLLDGSYYYEFTIYAEDNDGNEVESELRTIDIYEQTINLEEINLLNSPVAGNSLLVEAVIVGPFEANMQAWLIYTKDYSSKEYQVPLIQDSVDVNLYTGGIPGQSAGTKLYIGVYAINDSVEVYYYDQITYTYPVKDHQAILKVMPHPFDPYQRDSDPDNDTMLIKFFAQRGDRAIMRIYNSEGKLMLTPENKVITSNTGENSYLWNGRDKYGELLPWGLYICHLEVQENDSGDVKTAQVPIVIGGPLK